MIIRQDKAKRSFNLKSLAIAGGLLLAVVALYFLLRKTGGATGDNLITVDMETVADAGGEKVFVGSDNSHFKGGGQQSNAVARSGKHSVMLDKGNQFALTYELLDVNGGDRFLVEAWRFSPTMVGNLIADGSWGYYATASPSGRKDLSDWEHFQLEIKVPDHVQHGKIKIYVWNPKEDAAYYDDLSIKTLVKIPSMAKPEFGPGDSLSVVNLVIEQKDMEKLQRIRREAMEKGILAANVDAWVDVRVEEGKGQWRGKVRLKGDWTDHLQGDKWSYRVALGQGQAWRRMLTFSFQSPHTRSFLDEWFFHQWLDAEDLLSPRYDFVELKVNGLSKGVYVFEEHFEKQIVEYNERREGPIMKFNEEGFWEIVEQSLEDGAWFDNRVPYTEASTIDAFGVNRALKDPDLAKRFNTALVLMEDYKNNRKPVDQVFDVDKLARYYAILDITQAYHGLVWHNQRLYYNPVISRMEPIGFDGYTADGPLKWLERPFMGHGRNLRYVSHSYKEQMFSRIFADQAFLKRYVGHLWKFTDPAYLRALFGKLEKDIAVRERWVKAEWPQYSYKRSMIFEEARLLRQTMMPLKQSSVKVHKQGTRGNLVVYQAQNYHCLPVKLLGVGNNPKTMASAFADQPMLDSYVEEYPAPVVELAAGIEGKFLFFEVPGIDTVFTVDILPWAAPGLITTEQEMFKDIRLVSNDVYEVDTLHKEIVFHAGPHKSNKDILIPAGWLVKFNAGAQLDLTQKAKFISKSPVVINGTEDQPVLVHSSDKSANGFTLLQPEGKCEWRYGVFENMNTLDYKDWQLTGAVTLYEADILFDHCRFVNNHCEDALNTIRCTFDFYASYVGNTFGDGFDADFCHGIIREGNFFHTGNDCMDFSGSYITIKSAFADQAGDKGISLGEQSTVTIENAEVRNSVIGFAAKDLTKVTVKNVTLIGNETAIAAYQKKPEYGPSTIIVEKYKMEGNKNFYMLQNGSELHIDGKVIKGKL